MFGTEAVAAALDAAASPAAAAAAPGPPSLAPSAWAAAGAGGAGGAAAGATAGAGGGGLVPLHGSLRVCVGLGAGVHMQLEPSLADDLEVGWEGRGRGAGRVGGWGRQGTACGHGEDTCALRCPCDKGGMQIHEVDY